MIALTSAVHCGDPSFSSNESSGGGDAGTAGGGAPVSGGGGGTAIGGSAAAKAGSGSGTAGGSSDAGSGANEGGNDGEAGSPSTAGAGGAHAGAAGEAGAGGEPACNEGGTCAEGTYCGREGACQPCADLTTLADPATAKFGAPEPLSVLNNAAGDFMLRTPRAFGAGNALLYVREFFGGEIWLTGDPEREVGAPLPSPINEPNFVEASPVWIGSSSGSLPYNFVFNRAVDRMSPQEFQGAFLETNGAASELTRLPAPFNPSEALAESVYAMAVSRDRAWWSVNRDLQLALQFLTAPIDGSGPPSVVTLRDQADCNIVEFDFGAWVTPDGKLLLINSVERTADCLPVTGEPHDVLLVQLDASGHPLGAAQPFPSASVPGLNESDGSLSPDLCTLYFVADVGGKLRIMQSRREQ